LEDKLKNYNLENFKINVKQGFTSLSDMKNDEQFQQLYNTAENIGVDLRSFKTEFKDSQSSETSILEEMKAKVEDLEARLEGVVPPTKKDAEISSSSESDASDYNLNQE